MILQKGSESFPRFESLEDPDEEDVYLFSSEKKNKDSLFLHKDSNDSPPKTPRHVLISSAAGRSLIILYSFRSLSALLLFVAHAILGPECRSASFCVAGQIPGHMALMFLLRATGTALRLSSGTSPIPTSDPQGPGRDR